MSLDCNISLHPLNGTSFYSGSPIVGEVHIILEEAIKIKDIVLSLTGNGYCRWTESRGIGKNRYAITLHGTEDYILTDVHLLQPENGESSKVLEPGTYTYPFETSLPHSIPSSLEKSGAFIRYGVNVAVRRPWKWDLKFCSTFTVISQQDLNSLLPQTSINFALVKKITNLFSSNGEICLKLRSPSSAYMPGQTIQLQYMLQNKSKAEIKCLKAKLVEMLTFISNANDCHTRRQPMSEVSSKEFSEKIVNTMFLAIPNIATPMLQYCNIIKVEYYIEVKVKMSGFHSNPTILVPVKIINVPLSNSAVDVDENWDMCPIYYPGDIYVPSTFDEIHEKENYALKGENSMTTKNDNASTSTSYSEPGLSKEVNLHHKKLDP